MDAQWEYREIEQDVNSHEVPGDFSEHIFQLGIILPRGAVMLWCGF